MNRMSLRVVAIIGVSGLLGGAACEWLRGELGAAPARAAEELRLPENDEGRLPPGDGVNETLGVVRDGRFHPVAAEGLPNLPVRLTAIRMQEAIAPEAGELDLSDYEGRAIMVRGLDAGGWVYSAAVVDHAGPILTAVVERVFAGKDVEEDEG